MPQPVHIQRPHQGRLPRLSERLRTLRAVLVYLAFLCLLFGSIEAIFRFVVTPGEGFLRHLFHVQLKVSRRLYLDNSPELLDTAALVRPCHAGKTYVQQPEADRPAFDRINYPFMVQTNTQGFREQPYSFLKMPGIRRIAFLGDSNTWGKGLRNKFRYSDILRERLGPGVETLNFGLEGCASDCLASVLNRALQFSPDLVVLQVSGNDLDQTIWRVGKTSAMSSVAIHILRLLSKSRVLMTINHALFGDPHPSQMAAMIAQARSYYEPTVQRIFRRCQEAGIPIIILGLAYADGIRYGDHYFDECRRMPDTCRAIVVEDFANADRYLANAPGDVVNVVRRPDWVAHTADEMDVDDALLDQVFPHRSLFLDIVHMNRRANWIVAQQLLPVLGAWLAESRQAESRLAESPATR